MNGAAENTADDLIHHSVVGIALAITLLEPLGEQKAADEVANRDVAAAELGFQEWFAIASHGVEKHLPVGLLDQAVHLGSRAFIAGSRCSVPLALDGAVVTRQVADAAVLRAERVPKEREGHSVRRE